MRQPARERAVRLGGLSCRRPARTGTTWSPASRCWSTSVATSRPRRTWWRSPRSSCGRWSRPARRRRSRTRSPVRTPGGRTSTSAPATPSARSAPCSRKVTGCGCAAATPSPTPTTSADSSKWPPMSRSSPVATISWPRPNANILDEILPGGQAAGIEVLLLDVRGLSPPPSTSRRLALRRAPGDDPPGCWSGRGDSNSRPPAPKAGARTKPRRYTPEWRARPPERLASEPSPCHFLTGSVLAGGAPGTSGSKPPPRQLNYSAWSSTTPSPSPVPIARGCW